MKASEFIKNTLKYCIPSVVSAIVAISVIPIISRVYPTAEYGVINLFYSVGNMLLYIVLMGLDAALIRFYYEQPKDISRKELFQLALWTGIIIDAAICIIAIIFFPTTTSQFLFGENKPQLIILMAVYIVGLILFRLLSIETRMENKAGIYNVQQILLIFSNRVSFVIVAFFSTHYTFSIVAITFSTILIGAVFVIIQKNIDDFAFPKVQRKAFKEVLAFAIPLMPTTVMTWLNNSAGKMVLSAYNNFALVGVLSIATSVANIFSLIPAAFATYWSPFIYKNYNTEQLFIKRVHSYICLLSIIIIIGIFLLQDILYYIVGGDYKQSQPYFMLIMLAPIQSLLCETTSYGIILSNKTKYNLYISIAAVLFNIGFSAMLYPAIGINAVVIGIAGAAIIQLVAKTIIGQHYYSSIEKPFSTVIALLIILTLTASNYFIYNNIKMRLLLSGVVAVVTAMNYKIQIKDMILSGKRYLNSK